MRRICGVFATKRPIALPSSCRQEVSSMRRPPETHQHSQACRVWPSEPGGCRASSTERNAGEVAGVAEIADRKMDTREVLMATTLLKLLFQAFNHTGRFMEDPETSSQVPFVLPKSNHRMPFWYPTDGYQSNILDFLLREYRRTCQMCESHFFRQRKADHLCRLISLVPPDIIRKLPGFTIILCPRCTNSFINEPIQCQDFPEQLKVMDTNPALSEIKELVVIVKGEKSRLRFSVEHWRVLQNAMRRDELRGRRVSVIQKEGERSSQIEPGGEKSLKEKPTRTCPWCKKEMEIGRGTKEDFFLRFGVGVVKSIRCPVCNRWIREGMFDLHLMEHHWVNEIPSQMGLVKQYIERHQQEALSLGPDLQRCPHCSAKVRAGKIDKHIQKAHKGIAKANGMICYTHREITSEKQAADPNPERSKYQLAPVRVVENKEPSKAEEIVNQIKKNPIRQGEIHKVNRCARCGRVGTLSGGDCCYECSG